MRQEEPGSGAKEHRLSVVAGAIAQQCIARPITTIWVYVVITIVSALLVAFTLKVDTDPSLMISNDLPASSSYQAFMKEFPALQDMFLVMVDSDDAEKGRNAAGEIASAMARRKDLFTHVFAPGNGAFFDRFGPLYLPEATVEKLVADIKTMTPLFNAMTLQPDLAGLDDLFKQMAPVVEVGRAPEEMAGLFAELTKTIDAAREGKTRQLDWAAMGAKRPVLQQNRWFVFAKPVLDYKALDAAAAPLAEVRSLMAKVNDRKDGVKVQLTGDAALNAEEFETVTKGAALAGLTSFALVTVTVLVGLPTLVLVVPALALIVMGLIITAGIATLTVGYLNMISVAFAVLFIGLGVDYAVHVVLRFAEEHAKGHGQTEATLRAVRHTGMPLALCTITTSFAFLTFLLTDFVGMAQLGIISAAGVTVAFLASISLVPAILCILPVARYKLVRKFAALHPTDPADGRHTAAPALRKYATIGLILLAALSMLALPQARFDSDPINLKDPKSPGMIAFNDLADQMAGQVYAVHLVVEPGQEMEETIKTFEALPEVARVTTIQAVIPQDQARKIAHLQDLEKGLAKEILPASPMGDDERAEYFNSLLVSIKQIAKADQALPQIIKTAHDLETSLESFLAQRSGQPDALRALEGALVNGFPAFFTRIRQLATITEVTPANIADGFKERFIAPDGRWRLEILPKQNMRDSAHLDEFVTAVTAINPRVTGAPVDIKEAAEVVAFAILLTYSAAFTLILLVLWPVLRRLSAVLLVLAPLLLAGLLMVGYTVVFSAPFNFANVIVLPLLLGLGVDSAIHYVLRARAEDTGTSVPRTWTPRAVLISSLTTMGSFGTLWLSSHLGLASMGELLCVAVFFTLLCTLVVLPQLIEWTHRTPKKA